MRRITFAITACALLLAVSIVSPALGGPSIGKVAKQAKKAFKIGKSAKRAAGAAKRTASAAQSAANAAQGTANTANSKADQALARPAVTPGGITAVSNTVGVAPESVAVTSAVCPSGQRVVSGGVASEVSIGGTWVDVASAERTAWIGAAEDLPGGSGGDLTVVAYCVPTGRATIASRAAVIRKVNREVKAYKASR
ncbi:MAG: alanine-zipper protein [Thermoleophilaceae bacterium]